MNAQQHTGLRLLTKAEQAELAHDIARGLEALLPARLGLTYDTKLGHQQDGRPGRFAYLRARGEPVGYRLTVGVVLGGHLSIEAHFPTRVLDVVVTLPKEIVIPQIGLPLDMPVAEIAREICTRLLPLYEEMWPTYLAAVEHAVSNADTAEDDGTYVRPRRPRDHLPKTR